MELANGKYGVANFMGPGTQVVKRIRRGDKGRTPSDSVAMRHDLDYALASGLKTKSAQRKAGRDADNRMISSIKRLEATGGDAKKNILMGKAIIAKTMAEDIGVLSKDKFLGKLENMSDKDAILLKSKRAELSQQGYGHPGEKLKHKLMMSQKGNGYKLAGKHHRGRGHEGDGLGITAIMQLAGKKHRQRGRGAKMDTLVDFIKNGMIPNLITTLGIKTKVPMGTIISILKKQNPTTAQGVADVLTKILMPILVKGTVQQSGGSIEKIKEIVKKVQPDVYKKLKSGILKAVQFYFDSKKQSGSGVSLAGGSWRSWWAAIKAALRVVGKLALKYGAKIAIASGHPILAGALGAIDSQISWKK